MGGTAPVPSPVPMSGAAEGWLAGWQACMTGEAGQKGPTPLNPVQLHWPQEIARPAQLPAEKDGEISSLPHPHPKP